MSATTTESAWADACPDACTPDLRPRPALTWDTDGDGGWVGTYRCPDCGQTWDTGWGHDMNGDVSR